MACDQRVANLAVSRIIPLFLAGIIIYSCFVITRPLCVDYFLNPSLTGDFSRRRVGLATGLLIGFYILLVFIVAAYIRLLVTIIWNPGYIPRGPQWARSRAREAGKRGRKKSRRRRRKSNTEREKGDDGGRDFNPVAPNHAEKAAYPFDASGLEAFYSKDVFVCEPDGRPPWCSTCCQFKSDRAHHCSEVNRCVRKMDHFCPWVGGVVSETSFKFFIQFLFYGFLFALYNVIVMSVFLAELHIQTRRLNVHLILILALSGFLGLFALGMLMSSVQLAWRNSSTIENLDRRTKVWTLAVFIPRPMDVLGTDPVSRWARPFPVVSFPTTFSDASLLEPSHTNATPPRRDFAILHTRPGENPFDLGNRIANLNEVMGYTVLDWLLPLKHSPCADHSGQGSAFRLGPVVERLKREAGLIPSANTTGDVVHRRTRQIPSREREVRPPREPPRAHRSRSHHSSHHSRHNRSSRETRRHLGGADQSRHSTEES